MPLIMQLRVACEMRNGCPAVLRVPKNDRQGGKQKNSEREPWAGFAQMDSCRWLQREINRKTNDFQRGSGFAQKAEAEREADDEPVARFSIFLNRAPASDDRPHPAQHERRIN